MSRLKLTFCFAWILFGLLQNAGPRGTSPLKRAPTVYIAARTAYEEGPSKLYVRVATNLPPKSLLSINVYDFIGEGSHQLSADTVVEVPKDGLLDATVMAAPGKKFRPNMACQIIFMPQYPRQEASVLAVVGRRGENLGSPTNPQAGTQSGEYDLEDLIYVP